MVNTGAGSAVAEVSVEAVVVIWAYEIVSPLPSESAPVAVAFSVTLPLLLTMAAVSTPPDRSPPVPATAVPLPNCAAVGEKVMRSMVGVEVSTPVV